MPDSCSNQEGDSGPAKSSERRGKGESASAAFRRILLGQPERIDSEVGATQAQEEKANKKPRKRRGSEIENFPERECNKHHHQSEENGESTASAQPLSKPGHRQAAKNRSERDHHDSPGGELRNSRTGAATSFGNRRDSRRNVHGSSPQTTDGNQHQQSIHNRTAAQEG